MSDQTTKNRPANLGTSMADQTSRLDGVAKVTGRAKYGRDHFHPNTLYAAFVRCPYGQGTLTGSNVDAARAVPGVVEVEITRDAGRYAGQHVGHVAAESPAALRRGLRALDPKWELGEFTTCLDDGASEPDAPNDATAQRLAGAAHVVRATYETEVQTHSSLETHGTSIDFDGERAHVYASTQGTFASLDGLDQHLGIDRAAIEVRCEYVGGGFGSKLNGVGKEDILAAQIAQRHKRPVYVFVNRKEEHLDTGNRPSSRTHVEIGIDDAGRILGGLIHTWGGCGVARGGGGVRIPSGRYDLGDIQRNHAEVQFNAGGPRAFRAPGYPQAAFAEELMLDELATVAGIDPLELRLNHDGAAPRQAMYERGAEIVGWSKRQATGGQRGTIRTGYGVGSTDWFRIPAQAEGEVVIQRDGSVIARSGAQDIGTGFRTIVGIAAAERLGIAFERVRVEIGRSSLPIGPGSGGSMTTHNVIPAIESAADDARQRLLRAVAESTSEAADTLELTDGAITRNGEPFMSWNDACARVAGSGLTGRGAWGRRSARTDQSQGHSQGVQFARVDVDVETGVIDVRHIVALQSCGRVLCRKTAESQVIGGVIQGLSYALFEHKLLDRSNGAMVNPNLEWYRIAGTNDMPHIEPILVSQGQDGVRSLGEPPTIPTSGAIACAVYNAIGTPVRSLPLTPDRVLTAIEEGGAA